MQTRRKMIFYRLIAFLIMAGCGALLTWAIANSLAAGHFDYSAFIANDKIRFLIEEYGNVFCAFVTMLWVNIVMLLAEIMSKLSLDFATYMELIYLFVTTPVCALLLTYFYVTGTEIPFAGKVLLWVGITNALWLTGRFIRRYHRHWTKLDRTDAEIIYTVFGKNAVLKRTRDEALCFDGIFLNASLAPSLRPGQSVELEEIRKD